MSMYCGEQNNLNFSKNVVVGFLHCFLKDLIIILALVMTLTVIKCIKQPIKHAIMFQSKAIKLSDVSGSVAVALWYSIYWYPPVPSWPIRKSIPVIRWPRSLTIGRQCLLEEGAWPQTHNGPTIQTTTVLPGGIGPPHQWSMSSFKQ